MIYNKPAVSAAFSAGYYIFAACVALIVLKVGIVPQKLFPLDSFVLITGAWKIVNGFTPYIDFSTLYGPANYYVLAGMMELTHNSPLALPLSVIATLVPISILSWTIASARYNGTIAFWLASYLTLLWASSVPLHFFCFETSYANFENREGYVLVGLITLLLLPTPKKPELSRLSVLCAGVLLGLLLFIKVNYFYSAALLAVLLLGFNLIAYTIPLISGFILGIVPFVCLLSIKGVIIMFQELRSVVEVRSGSLYYDAFLLVIIEIPILFVVIWDLFKQTVAENGVRITNELELATIFMISASLEFGAFASVHMFECPLIACYAIILVSRLPAVTWNSPGILAALLFLNGYSYGNTLLGICSPPFFKDYLGVSLHQVNSTVYPMKTVTWSNGSSSNDPNRIEWANYINDGIALIEKHRIPADVPIGSLNVADFFSYPLGHTPPAHTYVWLSIGVTVGTVHYPAPDYLLSGCGYVMIPVNPSPQVDFLGRIPAYKSYVASQFHQIDKSEYWELYQFNDAMK